tara:strand:+ start:84 stop:1403 length:1320 start_codon:yes stop_codon:yes gene_type:complete
MIALLSLFSFLATVITVILLIKFIKISKQNILLIEQKDNLQKENAKLILTSEENEKDRLGLEDIKIQLEKEILTLKSEFANSEKFHQKEVNLRENYLKEFEHIAKKTMELTKENFVNSNKQEMDRFLTPFKTKINEFEAKVADCYDKELRDKISLKKEMEKLLSLNTQLSNDANNLTNALKGENKIQGNWGEVILERILERSGLNKGEEYEIQEMSENNLGQKIQPDVIIHLPENKHIIIDSKVSLKSYEKFINSDDEQIRSLALKEHLRSIKNHIDSLSQKNYQTSIKHNSLDFILMFMPIEAAYMLALQYDNQLFSNAWEKKILIVSPTSLHSTLKIISSLWKQEKQNRNVKEIARLSGALYDKFVGYLEDMQKIGRSINNAQNIHQTAMNKLSLGKGNIINRFEQIKKLGAKTSKNIDDNLTNDTEELLTDKETAA